MLCVHISTYCYEVMCEICCCVFISVLTVTRWCVKYVVVCSYQYLLLRGDVWDMLCVHISTYCYEVMCEICCCVFISVLTVTRWCVKYVVVCSYQYLLLRGDVWDMLCVHISTYCYEVMCAICCVLISVLTVTRWCVRYVVVYWYQYLLLWLYPGQSWSWHFQTRLVPISRMLHLLYPLSSLFESAKNDGKHLLYVILKG